MIHTQNFDIWKSQQLIRLSEWTKSYETDFVAHGIVSQNINSVLTDGRLRCAENVLRRTKRLEFEGGSCEGEREVISLPQDILSPKDLESIKEIVASAFELTDDKIETMIRRHNLWCKAPSEGMEKLRYMLKHSIHEGDIRYTLSDQENLHKKIIKFALVKYPNLWSSKDKPRDPYIEPLLAIYIDQALPKDKRCKAQLGRILNIYQRLINEKAIDMSLIEINTFLREYRKVRLLNPYKITGEIRVYKNSYIGCYGEVRVIIGGTEHILGSKPQATGEYYLLSAGQNSKFFKVDLSSPNVLIIGPQKLLSDFANDSRFGKNVIFAENIPESWVK